MRSVIGSVATQLTQALRARYAGRMGKKHKPATAGKIGETPKLTHNPFGSIAVATSTAAHAPAPPIEPVTRAPTKKTRGRLVLRRETKHRGGKAVVVVAGFAALREIDDDALAALAKELKRTLGCGGTVEDATREIVLQGDHPAKVAELLRSQGFRVDGVTA
jgi:translation initiation factor 1